MKAHKPRQRLQELAGFLYSVQRKQKHQQQASRQTGDEDHPVALRLQNDFTAAGFFGWIWFFRRRSRFGRSFPHHVSSSFVGTCDQRSFRTGHTQDRGPKPPVAAGAFRFPKSPAPLRFVSVLISSRNPSSAIQRVLDGRQLAACSKRSASHHHRAGFLDGELSRRQAMAEWAARFTGSQQRQMEEKPQGTGPKAPQSFKQCGRERS